MARDREREIERVGARYVSTVKMIEGFSTSNSCCDFPRSGQCQDWPRTVARYRLVATVKPR